MTAIEFEKRNISCRGDKIKEEGNAFPGKQGCKELISVSTEVSSSEIQSGRLMSILSKIGDRRKDHGGNGIPVYTNDCLRDYYFLKNEGVRFLNEPSYTTDGLVAEFVDRSGKTYILVEERNYSED